MEKTAYIKNFEVLKYLNTMTNENKETDVLLIFHLLDTSVDFIELLSNKFNVKSIIGIPYSVNDKALKELEIRLGNNSNIIIPNNIDEIQNIVLKEISTYTETGKIAIIEVGGYCAKIADKIKKIRPNIIGIVEDTNQGHWEYESLKELPFPIYSIAQSPIKQLENRLIGKAVTFSLDRILRNKFYMDCSGKKCGVLGYGKIGKATARALKGKQGIVSVWDIDPVKRIQARLDGYLVANSKKEFLENNDIIIGVSGKQSIRNSDFEYLKPNTILASGSSKKVEFDIEYCNKEYEKSQNGVVSLYSNHINKFYILNEGMPINFDDNSVLDTTLDLIFSELYMCLNELLKENNEHSIHQIPKKLHDEICLIWEKKYA